MFPPTYFPPAYFPPTYFPGGSGGPALDFRQALVARLLAEAAITSVVGQKVLPGCIPETENLPALVYLVSEVERVRNLTGYCGVSYANVKLFCSSFVQSDCVALAKSLRDELDGYSGLMAGAVTVIFTQLLDEDDDYLEPDDGSDKGTHIVTLEFKFKFRESIPSLN